MTVICFKYRKKPTIISINTKPTNFLWHILRNSVRANIISAILDDVVFTPQFLCSHTFFLMIEKYNTTRSANGFNIFYTFYITEGGGEKNVKNWRITPWIKEKNECNFICLQDSIYWNKNKQHQKNNFALLGEQYKYHAVPSALCTQSILPTTTSFT